MQDENRIDRLSRCLGILGEAFQKEISLVTLEAYSAGLSDVPIEIVEQAAGAAIVGLKFFPRVFELRALCGFGGLAISPEDRASTAWAVIRREIARTGGYYSVVFDDPVTTATVRQMGGWERFCSAEPGKELDTWLRQDFCSAYKTLIATGFDAELAKPLPGLVAVSHGESGYDLPVPMRLIVTGLPPVAKNVVRGVIRGPDSHVALPAPVRQFVKTLGLPEECKPPRATGSTSKEEAAASLLAWQNSRKSQSEEVIDGEEGGGEEERGGGQEVRQRSRKRKR